ncbi:MAG: hypothetical protein BGO78_11485 [Chloroflexi bacterium 44-23]|nr:MAG: hypothetical protein BGO78_11485 [Chloroflexi bacterium 44-23]
MKRSRPIEPGLIRIFRFFVWAEAIAFLMVPLAEKLFSGQSSNFYRDPFYIIFLQSLLLAIYLSIPWLRRKLRQAYLLIALVGAIVIPAIVVDVDIMLTMSQGLPVDMLRIWALLPLLMIPLVPTAWQYDFRVVFILFAGLGILDGFALIWFNGGMSADILMPLFAIFIRIVTLTLVGLMITELMHTQREQRKDLMRANLKLSQQALVQEQLATSRERNRLARELHDTLAHTLSGLTVQLEAMHTVHPSTGDKLGQLLITALETSRNGLEETRRALKALRAEPLEDLGLSLSLHNLVKLYHSRTNIAIELEIPEHINQFSHDEEQAIYRITQEALENILRHSQASHVWLSLQQQEDDWVYRIRDDGKGFDVEDEENFHDRLGLQGIRERADMIFAELSIKSTPNKGTTIQLVMRKS